MSAASRTPRVMVILASTRPGRAGAAVARWFQTRAEQRGDAEIDLVDLRELGLPFLDEPHHPRLRRYEHAHTRAWSRRVDAADAFVLITPEYNHGYPGTLKNAIDFLHEEWRYKAVGFVSYGGVSAGTRSVQQLKQVLTALKLSPAADAVHIPFVAQFVSNRDGEIVANDEMNLAADTMLDEVLRLDVLLAPRRTELAVTAG